MSKKILHLTLKRKWFDLIAIGEKTIEYREDKLYWTRRLCVFRGGKFVRYKKFDEVHFRNGYRTDLPFMRVKYIATGLIYSSTIPEVAHLWKGQILLYAIRLGEILEIKNWSGVFMRTKGGLRWLNYKGKK